jgi:hypothetical protein
MACRVDTEPPESPPDYGAIILVVALAARERRTAVFLQPEHVEATELGLLKDGLLTEQGAEVWSGLINAAENLL